MPTGLYWPQPGFKLYLLDSGISFHWVPYVVILGSGVLYFWLYVLWDYQFLSIIWTSLSLVLLEPGTTEAWCYWSLVLLEPGTTGACYY